MPKGYWIVHFDVASFSASTAIADATVNAFKKYDARVLVQGGPPANSSGLSDERYLVIQFEDYKTAVSCYESAMFREAKKALSKSTQPALTIIEGHKPHQPLPLPFFARCPMYVEIASRYLLASILTLAVDALADGTKRMLRLIPSIHWDDASDILWLIVILATFIAFTVWYLAILDKFFGDRERRLLIVAALVIGAFWQPFGANENGPNQSATAHAAPDLGGQGGR